MSDKIEQPYEFNTDETLLIENNFLVHEDWDKDLFSGLKRKIREDLRPKQNNKCCYCKKELGYDIKEVDIEHIIPKATYPNFTFTPKNLALSCPACNTLKGDKSILSKKVKRHPRHSRYHTIVHPHYDVYENHILIHNGCVFEAISKKGSHTITVCQLFRLKVVEKKAKESFKNKSKESELINLIMNASKDELAEAMSELIKRIK